MRSLRALFYLRYYMDERFISIVIHLHVIALYFKKLNKMNNIIECINNKQNIENA